MPPVNYLAILVAAVANMIVGAVWYSPVLFGRAWMAEIGKRQEDLGSPVRGYVGAFVAAFVAGYALARFLGFAKPDTIAWGVALAALAWIGFVATTSGVDYLFTGRSGRLYLINMGNHLVALAVMGAILTAWR